MIDLDKQFGTNKDAEKEGVWIDLSQGDNPTGFKIARMSRSNTKYSKALTKAFNRHKTALRLQTLPDEKAEAIEMEVFVDSILKDWRNVEVKGKPLPFNKENALRVLTSYPDLYEMLREEANQMGSFKDAEKEVAAKN